MKEKREKIKGLIISLIPIAVFLLIIALLTVLLWSDIMSLATYEGREALANWVGELGFFGWLITLGIQILQILLAFLPGEPVEIMLGVLWGPWLGTLTCLFGIFIGTLLIFLLVRKFGAPLVKKAVGERDFKKYSFLGDSRKIEVTVFILFFIPGTPKDALSYILPLLPIRPVKYLAIATLARIPSVVSSTILGDSIAEGRYLTAIIVFIITALVSVFGIIIGNRYVRKREKSSNETHKKDGE